MKDDSSVLGYTNTPACVLECLLSGLGNESVASFSTERFLAMSRRWRFRGTGFRNSTQGRIAGMLSQIAAPLEFDPRAMATDFGVHRCPVIGNVQRQPPVL